MCGLEWNKALLTMPLTSGAGVSTPAIKPLENILNIPVTYISKKIFKLSTNILSNKAFLSDYR